MNQQNHLLRHIGTAIAECPKCRIRKLIPVANILGKTKTMDIKCTACSNTFSLKLDFRRHIRKSTKLQGNFIKGKMPIKSVITKLSVDNGKTLKHIETGQNKNCTITDISLSGIAFEIWGPHSIRVNDKLFVAFHLDNKKYTLIQSEVLVKSVNKERIGAEFCEKVCKSEYGFYLWER